MELEAMHPADLERLVKEELDLLTPALRLYTILRTSGAIPLAAARRAGFNPTAGTDALERKTSAARRAYAEQANRLAEVDVTWLRGRLVSLYERTLGKGDEGVALACLREIGKLGGLYPRETTAAPGSGPVLVQVSLQLPARETPPSFLQPALPPPPVDPLT